MILDAVATGKTVDDAVSAACIKLGKAREDVEIEILELPKRGFLGLTHIPAKVRAFIEIEDASKKEERKAAEAVTLSAEAAPIQQSTYQKQATYQKPRDTRQPRQAVSPAPQNQPKAPAPAPLAEAAPKATLAAAPLRRNTEAEDNGAKIEITANGTFALEYVRNIISLMGAENVDITAAQYEKAVVIKITGEGAGAVIGRRGETLDALQYLTGLAANRSDEDYCRVVLDAGNYRQKRKQTLELLAKRLANNAIKTGRPTTLEPMNPYERRIIHATVSEIKGALSTSVGEEPNRSVVISSENSQFKPRTNAPRGRKPFAPGEKRPFNNDRRPKAPISSVAGAPAEAAAPVEVAKKLEPVKEPQNHEAIPHVREIKAVEIPDAPLYGKIEI